MSNKRAPSEAHMTQSIEAAQGRYMPPEQHNQTHQSKPHPVAHISSRDIAINAAENNEHKKIFTHLTLVGVLGNIILTILKISAGVIGNSTALISDGVHSLSDVFATLVAAFGAFVGRRAPDDSHPYGHDRFESIASLILAAILCVIAFDIVKTGILALVMGETHEVDPSWFAFFAALVSIGIKEAMFWYTLHGAKKTHSSAFEADAWHHRSDAASSVIAACGVVFAKFGFIFFDTLASIFIAGFIIKIAYEVARAALGGVLDESVDKGLYAEIEDCARSIAGVDHIDRLTGRKFASKVHIDISIALPGDMSVQESHDIAHAVRDAIIARFADIDYVMVHVNPSHE